MADDRIQKAIAAGEEALECLSDAIESLKSASRWGVVDILGGNFVSGLVKHSKIDDSREKIGQARVALVRLDEALEDASYSGGLDVSIDLSSFLSFADFFLDNPVTDLVVQTKLTEAQSQLEDTYKTVRKTVEELKRL